MHKMDNPWVHPKNIFKNKIGVFGVKAACLNQFL